MRCTDGPGSRKGSSATVDCHGVDRIEDRLRSAELHKRLKKVEADGGRRAGVPTEMLDRLKFLERENREMRGANEILRTSSREQYWGMSAVFGPRPKADWRQPAISGRPLSRVGAWPKTLTQ